jgi:hypothetical protein
MVLWTSVIYLSLKIPFEAMRLGPDSAASRLQVKGIALAIFAALAGTVGGTFFLSYAYKESLWIWLGLSGALYLAIRRHDDSFRVRFGLKDIAAVVAIDAALIAALSVYTRLKLGY